MKVSKACDIVLSGRKYPVSHLVEEIVETFEALAKRDFSEASLEFQQVLWGIQILLYQLFKIDFKIRFCSQVIVQGIKRRKVWKKIFAIFDIEFTNDYLTGGSNFKRFRKVQSALKSAGIMISEKQAIQIVELFYDET